MEMADSVTVTDPRFGDRVRVQFGPAVYPGIVRGFVRDRIKVQILWGDEDDFNDDVDHICSFYRPEELRPDDPDAPSPEEQILEGFDWEAAKRRRRA